MVVRINHENGKHVNFYEGTHVGFHPKGATWKEGVTVIVEGPGIRTLVQIEIDKGSDTQIYLMNTRGKTVEKIFV